MEKKSFIFYENWFEGIEQMPEDIQAEAYRAVMRYGLYGEKPAEDANWAIRMLFIGIIKQGVDDSVRRYEELRQRRSEAGKKGNEVRWKNRKTSQNIAKIANGQSATICESQKYRKNRLNDIVYREATNVPSGRKKADDKESQLKLPKESANEVMSYQAIANQWNDILGDRLPKVISVNEKRQPKVRLRMQELKAKNITFEDLFQRIAASSFLTGGGPRKWKATFDWVIDNPNNWVKVMEGTYDDEAQDNAQASQQHHGTNGKRLGPGEFYDSTGRRTYGTGKYTVPDDAPPRPSEQYYWNPTTLQWLVV